MILVPIICFLFGLLIGQKILHPATGINGIYLSIACLAGLDTICGGIKTGLEGKFRQDIFITGFFSNVAIAFFLAWLGDQIYLNTFLAVALVLGGRIFLNLSLIRRFLLTKWQDNRERKKQQVAQAQMQAAAEQTNPL